MPLSWARFSSDNLLYTPHIAWSGGIGFLLIQPPQEYAKKSTHGSTLGSMEEMSRTFCFVADCALERTDARTTKNPRIPDRRFRMLIRNPMIGAPLTKSGWPPAPVIPSAVRRSRT